MGFAQARTLQYVLLEHRRQAPVPLTVLYPSAQKQSSTVAAPGLDVLFIGQA